MKNSPAINKLNQTLRANGIKDRAEIDIAPEATAYFEYRKGKGERDAKKLERLRNAHLNNFYKYIAKKYPHLLFEKDNDESYFNYVKETGVYEDWKKSRVIELITQEMVSGGFLPEINTARLNKTLLLYRSMFPERGVTFDDFDAEENWFHCSNGWVALSLDENGKRKFIPHSPDMLSRRVSAVAYDEKAKCPHYDQMMADFQLKADQVRVIDQFSGLLLTGEIKHQKMLAFIGKPGCGKSTIAEVWGKVLGDMATRKDLSDLTGDRFRFIGESLVGRTLVHFDEVDVKRSEMGANLGNLITGGTFTLERKGQNGNVDVKNKLKCVLTANSLPMSAEVGIFRRMILIYFNNSFYDSGKADIDLPAKLESEFSGILNRMLRGLADLQKMGTFTVIEGHEEAIEEYKISSNTIAEFLDEYFEPGTWEDEVSTKVMFNTYVHWLGKNANRMVLTPQRFGQMLNTQPLTKFDIGIRKGIGGRRLRTGLKVRSCYKLDESEELLVPVNEDGVLVDDAW